jgi:Tfp pilus assembly protein PilF
MQPQAARFSRSVVLLLLMTFALGGFYSLSSPKNQFDAAKEQVIRNPNNIQAHLVLAEEFLNNNQLDKAQNELVLVDNLNQRLALTEQQSKVLGITSIVNGLWAKWQEANKVELEKLVLKWRGIVADNLNYRDGYLRLAIYYFRLGDDQKAKENLNIALKLDPNFEPAQTLQKLIP